MNTSKFELTPEEIDECYKEWPQKDNLTLFQLVARKVIAKVLSLFEPVELEALGDEEIDREWQKGINSTEKGWLEAAVKGIAQAQLEYNQSKGQLYRTKDV